MQPTTSPQFHFYSNNSNLAILIPRIQQAIQKMAAALSPHLGSDCRIHAELGTAYLQSLNIPVKVQLGYAAWRVGPGDGDVIGHSPETSQSYSPTGALAADYHAWIETPGGYILDFTTYCLPLKASQLDAADGRYTDVQWKPPFLFCHETETLSFAEVAAGYPRIADGAAHVFESEKTICHSYVTLGQIQFLSDCTHALAGKTVPLPEWDAA